MNKYKMLMMLSVVLMASALVLLISNFTGALEYSRQNIFVYSGLFALGIFFFYKNMKKSDQ